jgi:protein TonB
MPGDLFGDVCEPTVGLGSRKWYTVPVSLAAHAIGLGVVLVVPLMATGVLPRPRAAIGDVHLVTLPKAPAIPSPRRVTPAPPAVNRNAAPTEPPTAVLPETGLETAAIDPSSAGVEGGIAVPGAIERGLPEVAPPPPVQPPVRPVRLSSGISPPRKVHDVPPVYPPIALSARVQGIVILEATLDVDGRVTEARVLRSLPLLDQAALDAVRQWVYTPARLNGVAVPVIMTVTVSFTLR